jgi:hypothetical protein
MKTHFDPYTEIDDIPDQAMCGVLIGESYETTTNWEKVDCKRCINSKNKIMKFVEQTEANIIKYMGDFVEFEKRRAHVA